MSDLPTHPPPAYPPPPPPSAEQSPKRRALPVVLAVVTAVLLIGVAASVPLVLRQLDADDVAREGPVNLDAVEIYDDLDPAHTEQDVDYPQRPAVGGPHAPVWLECGVYDEPVREENVVHDLEHGTVWITYDPAADVDADALAGLLPQNGILSPYDDLGSPVVVTVWGRQLALDGADDPRLPLFIATYEGGETAPEPFASCAGGVRSPSGQQGSSV
ncbi:DUF3105 domain-containing protein [Nocardioides pyridinolyticus]